jgi:hypothetical protein
MDTKCAPSKIYKDGSCFTLKSLKKIAESYNLKNPNNKISISDNKEKMVDELEKKLSNKCNEQTCWLRMDFVEALRDEEIKNNTFRPEGPSKKNEWLSTSDINNVVQQYQEKYKNFLFLGAVPADFEEIPILGIKDLDLDDVVKNGKTKIGMVINLDEHWKSGSHWVALYTDLDKGQIYYFDSFAKKPYKRTRKFINRIVKYLYRNKYRKDIKINNVIQKLKGGNNNKVLDEFKPFDIKYNTIQHQFNNSECGVYSINFIVRLVRGESFDEITENITKDDEMNKCRGSYFRNVNTS